jgi:hypothetical protein
MIFVQLSTKVNLSRCLELCMQLPHVVKDSGGSEKVARRGAIETGEELEGANAAIANKASVDRASAPNLSQFKSFEEVVGASGMLSNYPPVAAGESGTDDYLVQPVQQLSWYPRHERKKPLHRLTYGLTDRQPRPSTAAN